MANIFLEALPQPRGGGNGLSILSHFGTLNSFSTKDSYKWKLLNVIELSEERELKESVKANSNFAIEKTGPEWVSTLFLVPY